MNTSASKEGLSPLGQGIALSPAQFEALSKSMESDEPIKALMTKTLNLMIEAEFEVKIGAKKSEQSLRHYAGQIRFTTNTVRNTLPQ